MGDGKGDKDQTLLVDKTGTIIGGCCPPLVHLAFLALKACSDVNQSPSGHQEFSIQKGNVKVLTNDEVIP